MTTLPRQQLLPFHGTDVPAKAPHDAGRRQRLLLRRVGALMRDIGISTAATNRPDDLARHQAAFIRALLASPDGIASLDDATMDLGASFGRGGRWRGSVTRSLSVAGLIKADGVVRSGRPSRHRGLLTVWRIADGRRDDLVAELNRLDRLLATQPDDPPDEGGPPVDVHVAADHASIADGPTCWGGAGI